MIKHLAKNITHFFLNRGIIPADEVETYEYGYEIILINILNWGIILFFMHIWNCYIETLIYVTVIVFMRHHTGGYHAKTHLACSIMSTVSFMIVMYMAVYYDMFYLKQTWCILLLFEIIVVIKFAPVRHVNNPVTDTQMKLHKRWSIILLVVFLISFAILYYLKFVKIAFVILLTIVQVCVSLLAEIHIKILNKEVLDV